MIAHQLYLEFFVKCVAALLLGYVIGYERQVRKKPAGIKTHALICLGAAVITFLSRHFAHHGDPGRLAAQIVSGIGFIGGGTIFLAKNRVQGLTSAATVWVSAAIGMLIGAGFIGFAVVATSLIVILFYIAKPARNQNLEYYALNIEILRWSALDDIAEMMAKFDISIDSKSIERHDAIYFQLSYSAAPLTQHLFLKKLFRLEGLGKILKV